jgi:hypothetical protein
MLYYMASTASRIDAYDAARARVPIKFRLAGGALPSRRSLRTALWCAVTFGLYGLFWNYQVSRGLRDTLGLKRYHPVRELVLTLLTLGLYGLWLPVRHARRVHSASLFFQRSHVDISQRVLWAMMLAPFTMGLSALWGVMHVQRQLNRFSRLANERERERRARADSAHEGVPASNPSMKAIDVSAVDNDD